MHTETTNSSVRAMLKSISLFSRLDSEHIDALSERFVTIRCQPGERILMQGEKIERFVVVLSGTLNVLRSSADGRERIVATLRPGMHFGLAEMITARGAEAAIKSDNSAVVAVISQHAFRHLVLGNPELCFALMQTMARSIFTLTRQLDYATFDTVEHRIIRRLISMAGACGINTQGATEIIPAPTHQDLASMVGAARETVSRVLSELKSQRLIETGYRKITLLNIDAMRERLLDEN